MKKILLAACCCLAIQRAVAADEISRDTIRRNGYTLIFVNKDGNFATAGTAIRERMIRAFFQVYPKLAKTYNKATLKQVTFVMDPAYDGVAATDNGVVTYSPKWMLRQPTDLDVVTHEVMHIVQDYKQSVGPGWLTEGIADYARYQFGIDNAGAKWALPDYKPGQHYTNSYRITARFLAWLEAHRKAGIVVTLNKSLFDHTYQDSIWKRETGSALDELWTAYTQSPAL